MSPPLPQAAAPPQYGGLHVAQKDVSGLGVEVLPTGPATTWLIKLARPDGGNLQADAVRNVMEVEDLIMAMGYVWES